MRLILSTLLASIALVGAAATLGYAYVGKSYLSQTIAVTGGSEVSFVSDLASWQGSFEYTAADLKSAYAGVKKDEKIVRDFLAARGFTGESVQIAPPYVSRTYTEELGANGQYRSVPSGYSVSMSVSIEGTDIAAVEKVSAESSDLIAQGVSFTSYAPNYYYTRLSEVKLSLLAKASADARERAEIIAKESGAKIIGLSSSRMGVFQILGKNSDEDYSEYGTFNTSSREKRATITVRSEFVAR